MKKSIISLIILLTSFIEAIDNNLEFSGYLRGTYHSHEVKGDKVYRDDAVGGKLHVQTKSYEGISLGSSVYATTKIFNDDNNPFIPLRGETAKSYAILGELYLQAELGRTLFKIGRQELNTPFADIDDIGMIPNTFEALTLRNNDIENLEIFLGQINKMAGVGAEVVDRFTNINANNNMQLLGLNYEGIENVVLAGWYNHLKNAEVNRIAYLESSYEKAWADYAYVIALQYAKESYLVGMDAEVWGAKLDVELKSQGLLLMGTYNKINNNGANSGFGGGPFFSASEFLIVDHAGADGSAHSFAIEYDASSLGINNLTLGLVKMYIETGLKKKSSELDLVANYALDEKSELHLAYVNVDGKNVGEKDANHFHIYVNYSF